MVRALIREGHSVSVLDDFSTGLESNLIGLDAQVIHGSILDHQLVTDAARSAEVIVHLAARGAVPRSLKDPRATHEVNATGSLNVLEAARLHECQVIFASSSSVYGANTQSPKLESMSLMPISPYAASKLAGEAYVQAYSRSFGVKTLILRFFNVFGPWQMPNHEYAAVIPRWIWQALSGQRLVVNGDLDIRRDFAFIDDVVRVISVAVREEINNPIPVNLAFGRAVTLAELLGKLREQIGPIEFSIGPPRPGDITSSENSPQRLFELFPSLKPTNFDVGLERTIAWLSSHFGPEAGR